MQQMHVRLPDDVHAWLAGMAEETGLTYSFLVGALLERARQEGWTMRTSMVVTDG